MRYGNNNDDFIAAHRLFVSGRMNAGARAPSSQRAKIGAIRRRDERVALLYAFSRDPRRDKPALSRFDLAGELLSEGNLCESPLADAKAAFAH